jgi:hypothetical protein
MATPLERPDPPREAVGVQASPRGLPMNSPLSRAVHPGAARMLIGDTYIGARLLGRTLRRVAGVRSDASLLTTLFVIGVMANAFRRIVAPALKAHRPRPPSFAGTMMVLAALREIPGSVGGAQTRNKPFSGTLIAVGLAAPASRRIVAPTLGALAALAGYLKGYGR